MFARNKKEKAEEGFLETLKTVLWALVIAGLFRTLLFQPFWIPSGSMKDTLLIGDFLFVNKMAYGYSEHSCPFSMCKFIDGRWFGSEPRRGDVIVFRHPGNGTDFVKRVVGMPGETVQMRGGVLHIDGAPVPLEPVGAFVETFEPQGPQQIAPRCKDQATVLRGGECVKDAFLETLPGGHVHSVLNVADGVRGLDDTPIYTVPEGHYFFMGDNRDNSSDSRVQGGGGVGFVPYENLLGRADRVIFSSAGRRILFFWTWRMDRFFEEIV